MADARHLLRALAAADRPAAVAGACVCARSVSRWFGADPRPGVAIARAEGWIGAVVSVAACRTAGEAAHRAAFELYASGGRAAANAAHAAGYAAGAVTDGGDAERAADAAGTAAGNAAGRGWREAAAGHLELLAAQIGAMACAGTVPSPAEVLVAPVPAQVAWDWLSAQPPPPLTVATLLEAHQRAARLGLDWADPVQRAVAERVDDEALARSLLRG
jgi:hypothetical protein